MSGKKVDHRKSTPSSGVSSPAKKPPPPSPTIKPVAIKSTTISPQAQLKVKTGTTVKPANQKASTLPPPPPPPVGKDDDAIEKVVKVVEKAISECETKFELSSDKIKKLVKKSAIDQQQQVKSVQKAAKETEKSKSQSKQQIKKSVVNATDVKGQVIKGGKKKINVTTVTNVTITGGKKSSNLTTPMAIGGKVDSSSSSRSNFTVKKKSQSKDTEQKPKHQLNNETIGIVAPGKQAVTKKEKPPKLPATNATVPVVKSSAKVAANDSIVSGKNDTKSSKDASVKSKTKGNQTQPLEQKSKVKAPKGANSTVIAKNATAKNDEKTVKVKPSKSANATLIVKDSVDEKKNATQFKKVKSETK